MSENMDYTMMFDSVNKKDEMSKKEVLDYVIDALNQKGYNAINQLTGYLISGDPTYITSHNDARSVVSKYEREDLLEVIVDFYIKKGN